MANFGGIAMQNSYAFPSHKAPHEGNGWGGIRTPGAFRHTRFPGVHNRPLCHPSEQLFLFLRILILVRQSKRSKD
jgi:hypothetical protein